MNTEYLEFFKGFQGVQSWHPAWSLIFILLTVWTLYWKYRALWLAAKKDSKWWFIAILVINTIGILEILYVYVFSKKSGMVGHKEENVPMVKPEHDEGSTPMVTPQG